MGGRDTGVESDFANDVAESIKDLSSSTTFY